MTNEGPVPAGTGMDRIRASAIELFGRHGSGSTSLRAIAQDADVSQALIVHHFGSKDGLRAACDRYVTDLVRATKMENLDQGLQMDPFVALRQVEQSRSLLRYLAKAMTEGGERLDSLIDDMLADAEEYMAVGERQGMIKSSQDPRGRAVILILWSLGSLVLHEQMARLLGVDLLEDDTDPASLAPYFRPVIELYTQGLLVEGAFEKLIDAFDPPQSVTAAVDDTPQETQ